MAKVSHMIVGLLTVSFIGAMLGLILADVSTRYERTFDNNDTEVYNKLENLTVQSQLIKEREETIVTDSNPLDKLGAFFDQGYQVVRLTRDSIDVYDVMVDEAVEDAGIGQAASYAKTYLGAVVVIVLIIGVLVSAIVKWGL